MLKILLIIIGSIILIGLIFFWILFKLIKIFDDDHCTHLNSIELSRNVKELSVKYKCKDCKNIYYKDIN